MFHSANAVLLFVILSVPLAQVNDKHVARFKSLVVTARAIESDESTLYKEGTHFVTVYVTMKNLGQFSVCASPVLVMLETTDGLQYGQTMLLIGPPRPFPKEPRTWAMLPGEETSGGYIFKVKDGAEPFELSLRLLPGIRCGLDKKTRTNAFENGGHASKNFARSPLSYLWGCCRNALLVAFRWPAQRPTHLVSGSLVNRWVAASTVRFREGQCRNRTLPPAREHQT